MEFAAIIIGSAFGCSEIDTCRIGVDGSDSGAGQAVCGAADDGFLGVGGGVVFYDTCVIDPSNDEGAIDDEVKDK